LPEVDREHLLNELSLYHGAPYLEGGTSIAGIDCSGLVRKVFGSLGVALPRTVVEQYGHGMPVSRRQLRTGDLLFFGGRNEPTHVGIAVSSRDMIHSSASRGVTLDNIDEFSGSMNLIGIRRIVRVI
jgi:cell wall-associated NlpC family hydrolase